MTAMAAPVRHYPRTIAWVVFIVCLAIVLGVLL